MEDNIKMGLWKNTIWDGGLDSSGSGEELIVGCCKYGNEFLGSMKVRKYLEQLSNYQLLRSLVVE